MAEDKIQRRFDGHLGRFDPTKNPQHYDPQLPWLPFVRRERITPFTIESAPLAIAWVSSSPRNGMEDLGRLDTALLIQLTTRNIELDAAISTMTIVATIKQEYWDDKPNYPTESEIRGLGGEHHFADAVDLVAHVQRGLKLKNAWIRAMNIIVEERREATTNDWLTETPFAVEDILGMWINGAKEEDVYWLLKHKVPCFIIHEVGISELYGLREDPRNQDFVALTDALYLTPKNNAFDHVALRGKASFNNDRGREGIPSVSPTLSAEDRVGSDPAVQGWEGDKHKLLEETPETIMRPVKQHQLQEDVSRDSTPPSSTRIVSVQELEVRTIAEDRVDWIVPPAIMGVTAGKWTFWKERDVATDSYYFCLVSSRPEDCERVCYDRWERREIFFIEGVETPPGVVSEIGKYGLPAPMARFVEMSEGKITKEHRASRWLYTTPTAAKGTAGQRAPTPSANELPLKRTAVKNRRNAIPPDVAQHPPPPSASLVPSSVISPAPSISLIPQPARAKPIPTEPRAHRLRPNYPSQDQEVQNVRNQFGRRPRAPSSSSGCLVTKDESRPKKIKSADILLPRMVDVSLPSSTNSNPSSSPSSSEVPRSNPQTSVVAPNFDTLGNHSSDSRFLCFEGLPPDWETCRVWFYSMAVSSHFVWINRMFRTLMNETPLIWLDMKSNEDACTLRGYLTHRTMPDNSLVISHFVTEATFNKYAQNATHSWTRPPSAQAAIIDDPMEGPGLSSTPLEHRLTSPGPSTPTPDVSLLHRAAVTLEERVEPPRRSRGGLKHRKRKAKQQQKA